jgi:hypothetical protein
MATKLKWFPVDTGTFKGQIAKTYEGYQKAQTAANEQRRELTAQLAKAIEAKTPEGSEPLFTYRFGKIAVAFVEEGSRKREAEGRTEAIRL